jgi:enoyl-CoA hydratase/carnithine racemase
MATVVQSDISDGVATFTLDRPEANNSWTDEMEIALFDLLDSADNDADVRAIIITGSGRAFCPGRDMSVLKQTSVDGFGSTHWRTRPMTHPLSLRKPTIAAINGACAGMGLTLALACDVRFAASTARMATSFARRGLPAEYGTSWLLSRLVGRGTALDLLISGRTFDAVEAHQIHLVQRVVPFEDLGQVVRQYAVDLAQNCSPAAVASIKAQLAADDVRTLEQSQAQALELVREAQKGGDFKEGIDSYVHRRQSQFAPLPPRSQSTP